MNRTIRIQAIGLLAGLLAWSSVPAANSDGASDAGTAARGARFDADVSFGFFSGDYGTDEQSDVEIVSSRLRWRLPRGEVRASFPYYRVSTTGEVLLVGGQPVGAAASTASATSTGSARGTAAATVPVVQRTRDTVEGPGDVRLHGELDLFRGGPKRPWVVGVLVLKLPTADEDEGLGTGETDVAGGLSLVQTLGRTSLLADARFTRLGDPAEIDYENVRSLGAGLAYHVGRERSGYLYAYAENRTHPTPGRDDRLDLAVGASRKVGSAGGVKLAGAAYVGLSSTAEDFGVSLTVGRAF